MAHQALSLAFASLLLAACSDGATSPPGASGGGTGAGDPLGSGTGTGGGMTAGGGTSAASGGGPSGGSGGSATAGGGSGGGAGERCAAAGLEWKTARKTTYTSYPDPESEECVVYNGCTWAGWFAGCDNKQTEEWVASQSLAALFLNQAEGAGEYMHHELCIRSGDKTMIVTVYDTCSDTDCDGCCTENKADKDALLDLESATNTAWGLPDGAIEWADLGTTNDQCE
jgi:hypothetical protein